MFSTTVSLYRFAPSWARLTHVCWGSCSSFTNMMHEDSEWLTTSPKSASRQSPPSIFELSASDDSWAQFLGLEVVGDIALAGKWEDHSSRALLWRLLLDVIPRKSYPSLWGREMSRKRDEYRCLKSEHRIDIAKVVDTTDPLENPLFSGSGGDNPWKHFYERKEMTDTIQADLERLFPTGCGDHFLAPARQQLLLNVLSLWADVHPATAYRQGMHEVLAPIVLTLEKEVAAMTRVDIPHHILTGSAPGDDTPNSPSPSTSGISFNRAASEMFKGHPAAAAMLHPGSSPSSEDLEADAFWMFSAVMDGLEGFYEHKVDPERSSGGQGNASCDVADSPVVEMCKRLQGSRLREVDPELQRHLAEHDISPQLYGMKWARLMFGREFRVESVLRLWDHMFASTAKEGRPNLPERIELVAVGMVMSIRDRLIAEDCTGCLQLLMRYPPDQNVSTVIDLALAMEKPGGYRCAGEFHSGVTAPASTVTHVRPSNSSPSPRTLARRQPGHSSSSPARISRGPSESTPRLEPGPAWLLDGGNRAGIRTASGTAVEVGGNSSRRNSDLGFSAEYRWTGNGTHAGGGGGGGVLQGEGVSGGVWDSRDSEDAGELKNQWQQGFDEFTRRAMSAAQGVAKMAAQTMERSQGGGGRAAKTEGLSAAEAAGLARRLRIACSTLEGGHAMLALKEIREIAQALESRSANDSRRLAGHGEVNRRIRSDPIPNRSIVSSASRNAERAEGPAIARGFSTYSDDDGRPDGLYTRDL